MSTPVTPLTDLLLADVNTLLHKQSLSNLDRILLELEAVKQDEGRKLLNRAADYTSSRGLIESTRNADEALAYIRATLFLQDHLDANFGQQLMAMEAN